MNKVAINVVIEIIIMNHRRADDHDGGDKDDVDGDDNNI